MEGAGALQDLCVVIGGGLQPGAIGTTQTRLAPSCCRVRHNGQCPKAGYTLKPGNAIVIKPRGPQRLSNTRKNVNRTILVANLTVDFLKNDRLWTDTN